jgi:hypothetical protein
MGLDWQDYWNWDELPKAGWAVKVGDSYIAHFAAINGPDAIQTAVQAALADYAAGYDAGDADSEGKLKVNWTLYRDGEEIDGGVYTFEAVRRDFG